MYKPIVIVPLKYGSVASALIILMFLVLFYGGTHPMTIPVFMDIRLLILPLFMFMGIKEFRDSENSRVLHFWQGLSIGFIICVVVGMSIMFFIYLFNAYDNDFLTQYIDTTIAFAESRKAIIPDLSDKAIIQEQIDKLPFTTTFHLAVDYFLKTLFIGLFWNIIISIVLRKQSNLT